MASTQIRVNDRPFYVSVQARRGNGYNLMFHEKYEWFGRTWGYRGVNKNFATKERDEVYDWFKKMVEQNTPSDETGEELLEEVISQLEEEFDSVEQA